MFYSKPEMCCLMKWCNQLVQKDSIFCWGQRTSHYRKKDHSDMFFYRKPTQCVSLAVLLGTPWLASYFVHCDLRLQKSTRREQQPASCWLWISASYLTHYCCVLGWPAKCAIKHLIDLFKEVSPKLSPENKGILKPVLVISQTKPLLVGKWAF